MTDHGWPGDDHGPEDDAYADTGPGHDDPAPEDPFGLWDHDDAFTVPEPSWHDEDTPGEPVHGIDDDVRDDPPADRAPAGDPAGMGPVGADPDAVPEPGGAAEVFPAAVDVGPLPEPVDGFPWIDTAVLGAAPVPGDPEPEGLRAEEIAGHAATAVPPGADAWAELAASDDPAAAALARFYAPGLTSPDS